ncbi:MAG: hypothetical protein HUJ80_07900 [Firmicutes bacterium]|nr:hypothetical protein [Bacillota bacterium]
MKINPKDEVQNWVSRTMEKESKYQDYVEFVQKTVDGSYIYTGPIFSYGEKNTLPFGRYKAVLWICSLLLMAVSLASGTLYIAGMNSAWQVIPLGLEIIMAYMTAWAAIRLTFTKQPMKIFEYRPTVGALPGRAQLTMYFAIAGFLAMMVYVFLHGFEEKVLATLVYMLARIVMAITSALLFKTADLNDWDETDAVEAM